MCAVNPDIHRMDAASNAYIQHIMLVFLQSADSAEVGRYVTWNQAINIKGGKENGLNLKMESHKTQFSFLHNL